jgi:tetratricopeptide (TPR) repeat protein
VNQRSEHLSNAQIEQYGKRASGAGPETEAWVETHLDDCPSCRSRVLEFQRTQFALLPDPKVNTVSSSNCPSEEDLRNLAAGLCAEPIANRLKAHVSNCERCGPLLQEYIEDFSGDDTPEEQAFLDKLKSASPAWQQKAAREMLKLTREPAPVPAPDWRRFFSWKWIMTPAAAAAACAVLALSIGGVTWYAQRDTPEKAQKLLAQASTERRTLEMRFPGATHSSYKQTLSGDAESLLNSPASLRQAAILIDSQLTKKPDDPEWLLLSARLNLLDWRYKPALASLDKIQDTKIIDSPAMRMTRALALYEQAEWETERRDQSYGEVINLLGKILQNAPDDPTALFNQALACERIHAYECAISDYERLLKDNDKNGWAAEAKDHLNRIKEKKTPES